MKKTYIYYVAIAILIFSYQGLYAQSDKIDWYGISSGFAYSYSDNSFVKSSIGQPLIGISSGTSSISTAGFLANSRITGIVGVDEALAGLINLTLYPNPVIERVYIEYELPEVSNVSIKFYDIIGIERGQAFNEVQNAGKYKLVWKPISTDGIPLPQGFYIVRMSFNHSGNLHTIHSSIIINN
jgi:hypothetical protein